MSEPAKEHDGKGKGASSCGSCEACPSNLRDRCDDVRDAPYRGWSLARMCGFYFVVPVVCAVVTASLAPEGIDSQSLAALAGLVGGMLLTTHFAGRWTRRLEQREQDGALETAPVQETRDG